MTDNGDTPIPPFPFGDLPDLPEPQAEFTSASSLSDAADESLPDWLAMGGLSLPPAHEAEFATLPDQPDLVSHDHTPWPGEKRQPVPAQPVEPKYPTDDTLSDYPNDQLEPLAEFLPTQATALPFEDQVAVTERITPRVAAKIVASFANDDELPLPPPYELSLDTISPFESPAPLANEGETTPTVSAESSLSEPFSDSHPAMALTRTPPPAAPLSIPPASAIWRTRKISIHPTFEENDTVSVYRTVIRDDSERGFLNCKVSFQLPAGLKQVQASRKPMAKKGHLHWNIGPLQPGEAIPLSVKLPVKVVGREAAAIPRNFELMYQPTPGARLVGEVTAPTIVPLNESFQTVVRVGNLGETASDKIVVRILNRTHPSHAVTGSIDALEPGESAEIQLNLVPSQTGSQDWLVTLESHGAETAESIFTTEAKTSTLSLELKHESMMRVDGESPITLVVRNDSAVPAYGVTAMLTVPEELLFASATEGEYDRSLNLVGWLIGNLEPGQARSVTATLRGFAPGLVGLHARVEGMSGSPTTATSNVFVEIDARSTSSSLDKLLAAMQEAVPDDVTERVEARVDTGTRHLIFELSETQYAVNIENVREVIRPSRVTPVPGMPDWLPGVANIRGDIISIVDLPRFLQVESDDAIHRGLLIAQSDDGQMVIGLLVNSIVGIRRVPPARAITPDLLDDNPIAEFLDGITELNGKLVPVIDLNVLFSSAELNRFQMA